MLCRLHAHVQDNLRAAEDTAHLDNGLCRYYEPSGELEFSGAGLGDDETDDAIVEEHAHSSQEPVRKLAHRYRKLQSRLRKIMSISDVYQSQLRERPLRD